MKIKSILSMLALVMLCSSSFGQTNWVSRFLEGCQLFGFNYPGYSAGFTLQIPLRNGSAKADYDRALNEREVSAKRKAATAQRIVIEVRNAYTQLEMNRSRITTARTARELAARRLDAEQKKFELGTSTVRFVLEEQRNVAQEETNESQALVNYTKTLV